MWIVQWLMMSYPDTIVPALLTPAMTSGSQDWFIVTQSTILHAGYEWWKAFDQIIGTAADCWHSNNSAGNWLQVQLPEAKIITNITLRTRDDIPMYIRWWSSYVLAGSNDWTNWTTIDTFYDSTAGQSNTEFSHDVSSDTAYLYYRMTFTQNGSYCAVSECTLLWY